MARLKCAECGHIWTDRKYNTELGSYCPNCTNGGHHEEI